MSRGTKQKFKQFSITCAEDACIALGALISGVSVNLEKYKEYASEAESLLESTQEEYVPAKEYDDVNDKLLYRQREILKLSADHQSSSFSRKNGLNTAFKPFFFAIFSRRAVCKMHVEGLFGVQIVQFRDTNRIKVGGYIIKRASILPLENKKAGQVQFCEPAQLLLFISVFKTNGRNTMTKMKNKL